MWGFRVPVANLRATFWLAIVAAVAMFSPMSPAAAVEAPRVIASRVLTADGGAVDWCRAKNLIAFDRQVSPREVEVFTIRPNGDQETCITCGNDSIPRGIRGRPVWHPSCDYMAIQVQGPFFKSSAYENLSWGFHTDIWFIAADGGWAQKVISSPLGGAVLEPRFSDDGLMLAWGDRRPTGRRIAQSRDLSQQTPAAENPWDGWALAVADVVPRPGARVGLANRRILFDRREGFVEPSAFVAGRIWHGRNQSGLPIVDEVRNVDPNGHNSIQVWRSTGTWKDRPVPSPNGKVVAISSSEGFNWHFPPDLADTLRTELWVHDATGGQAMKITHYNEGLRSGERALAIDYAWSPSGQEIAVYSVVAGIGRPKHEIRILTLDQPY